jgi:outer membrane lipoprotein-sorting protein
MDLVTLLELLYSASERSQTVRATVETKHYQAREFALLRSRGLLADAQPWPAEEGPWSEPPELIETTTQLWAARPHKLRWESISNGGPLVDVASAGVKDGDLFWQWNGDEDVYTNEHHPERGWMTTREERLLDPSPLLGVYRFEVGSSTTTAGRQGVEIVAKRRAGANADEFAHVARLTDHELALVVDEERGVLMRVATIVGREELTSSEMVEVSFDEPISPELFLPH